MKRKFVFFALAIGMALAALTIFGARAAHILIPGNPVVYPAPNAYAVLRDTDVTITYDEKINPASVTPQTFAVYGMQTGQRLGVIQVDSSTITLTPSLPFMAGELVYASATTATLSQIDGQGPLTPTVWMFWAAVDASSSHFYDSGQEILPLADSRNAAMGDMDGDGDLDIFVGTCDPDVLLLNDGNATFTESGQVLGGNQCSTGLKMGDLDGDGNLDVVVITSGPIDFATVWINNGNGILVDSGQNFGNEDNDNLSLGDLDGDGDLDIFLVGSGPNMVLFNDGTGSFTESGQPLGNSISTEAALGDVDGDGDLDALVANSRSDGMPNFLWLNDGKGMFTDSGQAMGLTPTNGVVLGDLDGDGDLDAFFAEARLEGATSAPNQVWFNDGQGIFTDSGQRLGPDSSNAVALGDMDGDGDLDVLSANLGGGLKAEEWMNDGTGNFYLRSAYVGVEFSLEIPLGDLDGDGDLDAYVTQNIRPDEVWINVGPYTDIIFMPYINR